MMKILIINGSPRKGNTWLLTSLVKEHIKMLDPKTEFDEIHLKDLNLPFCTGCSLCFRKGLEFCLHHEIIQNIMDKMDKCDGIIFSVTCFQMNVPALTKNFTDHLCFLMHRPRYFNKKALIVSTTGGVGARGATKFLSGTLYGWGFNRCYQLPISSISWNDYQPSRKDRIKSIKAATEFYNDLHSKKLHPPKFSVLIPFNLFRGMSDDYKPGTEFETQDGVYWDNMGFVGKTYSPLVPIPFYKRIFGNLLYHLAKVISSRMIVTYKKNKNFKLTK